MAMLVVAGLKYRLLSTGQGTSHHTVQINKQHQQCLLVLISIQNALLSFYNDNLRGNCVNYALSVEFHGLVQP